MKNYFLALSYFLRPVLCKNLAQVLFPVQNTVFMFLATKKDLYVLIDCYHCQ